MSSKLVFLLLGLLALSSVIEAKSLFKKFSQKEKTHVGQRLHESLRVRRDVIDESDEITDEEASALMKFFLGAAWQEKKVDILASFMEEMADSDTNITVVGWQRLVDDEGHVQTVNTIQLVIPPKPDTEGAKEKSHDDDDDDDEDDEDDDRAIPHNEVREMREILDPLAEVGIPAGVTMEEYNKKGEREVMIYINKDELYVAAEGYAIYNKTIVTSSEEEVIAFLKKQKPSLAGPPTILRYDVDGHLIESESQVYPPLLGAVIDHYEAPDNILIESPELIAKISQMYKKEEIPEHLAKAYNTGFPEYTWRVLVDPGHYYITRDVSITVSYDNFDFDENSDVSYVVYGVKK